MAPTHTRVGANQWLILLRVAMDRQEWVPCSTVVSDTAIRRRPSAMHQALHGLVRQGFLNADSAYWATPTAIRGAVSMAEYGWLARLRVAYHYSSDIRAIVDVMYSAIRRDRKG